MIWKILGLDRQKSKVNGKGEELEPKANLHKPEVVILTFDL